MPTLIPIIHIAIHLSLNVQTLSYNRDGAVIQSVQMSRYDKWYSLQQLYLLSVQSIQEGHFLPDLRS